MTGSFMQSTLRELLVIIQAPRLWVTFLVVVLLFTVTGPFSTDAMPVAIRFFYWLAIQATGWSTAILCAVLADGLLQGRIASPFARMMVGSLVAALPIGLWITLIDFGFTNVPPSYRSFIANVGISLPLSALFCILAYMTLRREIEMVSQPPTPACVSPAIMERLKPANRGQLLSLSAQDHYTYVVTSRGRELVLLRFSDALRETGETPGMQIHRSHWIADANVAELLKSNGGIGLRTRDGAVLPVSRSSRKSVQLRYVESHNR
ncbi:DNA-binding LytR/AlgR family response regulator [Ochrobactrum daejeonense]|uniref:DNA-binding LytR/AlgR family response regulator n=1 Tax=Brucella daejeonensis TaxID=659015 RepID=A0A7W9AXU9_9HYPH|nr:DNA-binding LytR/AlgR family response regulator [Brucella daejeonensis]